MNLDLDIQNYKVSDLETFFRLQKPYTATDIELNENQIRTLLLSSGHLAPRMVRDLIVFLDAAKTVLVEHLTRRKTETVRTIQQDTVIYTAPKSVVFTQQSDFAPGNLNPLDTRTVTRCISVDTRFRSPNDASSADFMWTTRVQKVSSLECVSFEFPREQIPNISAALGNNYLYMALEFEGRSQEISFVIPTGNYDTTLLMKTMNLLFQEQKTPVEMLLDPNGSEKVVLKSRGILTLDFTRNEKGEPDKVEFFSKMGRLLGFTRPRYGGEAAYLSETTVNTNMSLPYFFVSVEDYQRSPPIFESPILSQVLARVDGKGKLVALPRRYYGPVDLTRFRVKLLDPRGVVMDTNNNDYSFCLLLKTIYEP